MPCDTVRVGESAWARERREASIEAALAALEADLERGVVSVVIDRASGAVAFDGWASGSRSGVSDVCAFRRLELSSSMALKLAIERAELQAGRAVNREAVASGLHSHDGGRTWSAGH